MLLCSCEHSRGIPSSLEMPWTEGARAVDNTGATGARGWSRSTQQLVNGQRCLTLGVGSRRDTMMQMPLGSQSTRTTSNRRSSKRRSSTVLKGHSRREYSRSESLILEADWSVRGLVSIVSISTFHMAAASRRVSRRCLAMKIGHAWRIQQGLVNPNLMMEEVFVTGYLENQYRHLRLPNYLQEARLWWHSCKTMVRRRRITMMHSNGSLVVLAIVLAGPSGGKPGERIDFVYQDGERLAGYRSAILRVRSVLGRWSLPLQLCGTNRGGLGGWEDSTILWRRKVHRTMLRTSQLGDQVQVSSIGRSLDRLDVSGRNDIVAIGRSEVVGNRGHGQGDVAKVAPAGR